MGDYIRLDTLEDAIDKRATTLAQFIQLKEKGKLYHKLSQELINLQGLIDELEK